MGALAPYYTPDVIRAFKKKAAQEGGSKDPENWGRSGGRVKASGSENDLTLSQFDPDAGRLGKGLVEQAAGHPLDAAGFAGLHQSSDGGAAVVREPGRAPVRGRCQGAQRPPQPWQLPAMPVPRSPVTTATALTRPAKQNVRPSRAPALNSLSA